MYQSYHELTTGQEGVDLDARAEAEAAALRSAINKAGLDGVQHKKTRVQGLDRYMQTTADFETLEKLNTVIENDFDFRVMSMLKGYMVEKTWVCNCSVSELARAMGYDRAKVSKSLKRLAEIGAVLKTEEAGGGYVFHPKLSIAGSLSTYKKLYESARDDSLFAGVNQLKIKSID